MESSRNPASSPENTEENRIKLATHICENTSREDLEQFLYEDLLTHYEKKCGSVYRGLRALAKLDEIERSPGIRVRASFGWQQHLRSCNPLLRNSLPPSSIPS